MAEKALLKELILKEIERIDAELYELSLTQETTAPADPKERHADDWLSIGQVARELGKGYDRTRQLIRAGKIKSARIPGTKRLYVQRAWLEEAFCIDGAILKPAKKRKVRVW